MHLTLDRISTSPSVLQRKTRQFGRRIFLLIRSHRKDFSMHPLKYYQIANCYTKQHLFFIFSIHKIAPNDMHCYE